MAEQVFIPAKDVRAGRLDLYGRELLAVAGTRIKAVNNKDRNFTRNSLCRFFPLFLYLLPLTSAAAGGSQMDNKLSLGQELVPLYPPLLNIITPDTYEAAVEEG